MRWKLSGRVVALSILAGLVAAGCGGGESASVELTASPVDSGAKATATAVATSSTLAEPTTAAPPTSTTTPVPSTTVIATTTAAPTTTAPTVPAEFVLTDRAFGPLAIGTPREAAMASLTAWFGSPVRTGEWGPRCAIFDDDPETQFVDFGGVKAIFERANGATDDGVFSNYLWPAPLAGATTATTPRSAHGAKIGMTPAELQALGLVIDVRFVGTLGFWRSIDDGLEISFGGESTEDANAPAPAAAKVTMLRPLAPACE